MCYNEQKEKSGYEENRDVFLSLVLLCGCQQHSTKQKQVKQKDTIVLGYVNSDGYMKVKQRKYGFMNKQKQVMIPCEYDLITQEKDVYIAQKMASMASSINRIKSCCL